MADSVGRWSAGQDNAPPELTKVLADAHADLPSAAELARLEASLGPLLGPPGAALPTAPPAGLGPIKIAATVAVGAGLIAAGIWLTSGDDATPPSKQPPLAEPAEAPAKAPAAEHSAPFQSPEPSTASAQGAPSSTSVAPEPSQTHAPKRVAHQKPSEAELLNRARVALKQDPKRALSLTGQHKQLYPNGALSQEREVIAIDALARLNKKRDAEKRADRFDKQYPESAHKEKVRTSVDDD